jgi:hypothetical protein
MIEAARWLEISWIWHVGVTGDDGGGWCEWLITTLSSLWVPITYWVQLVLGLPLLLGAKGFHIQRWVFLMCLLFSGFKVWDPDEVWVLIVGGSTTLAFPSSDSFTK